MRLPESVGLLVDIVAVPSPTGHEEDAARMLADRLPRFGWETSHLDGAGSVIATRGNGDKELVLLSHIDTVPGGPKLFVNEERIEGRGSVDAKSPCCALAVGGGAVEVPRDWRITFVAAVGEEIDSRGARFRMPLHEPAALVVGEPTGSNGVALSYRGRILFSFVAEDSGAHRSGSPGPMSDTVLAAASMMQITENMGKGYSIAIMEMEGHEAGRRSASITMDLRTPIGAQQEELELMLNETAAAFGVGLNVIEYVPPHEVHKSDPVIRAFRTAIRDVTGEPPRVLAKQGTCDFNVLSTWGCPMGAFGPGDSKYDHSSNEQIEIKEFLRGIEVVKGALPKVMEAIR
ncbi:M20/M25/M40 family metallo-hydrolase [Cloacibacillus evryensis]|uniref:M20/M25/M40 family metallo-hydrolase n=2 Tax=root TaxID=1 RepID=A0AAW5K4H2_9BACT|nr:M20/M25/M40 family metallo-hydrolase [Cloacibacillus evryensis]EHL63627.1 N-acetyl-ornithine/N-acetyl-lysine deacetylase [Synergistes sp. 3_1_syn1]MCQ4814776.1 M20/M25/M40 family metallo-hydrolase [Cloacibacillus evryensis]MEA5034330.1 M20/M25/M40 family metallo-hydrolase [Cloacibacillus evryensis]